MSMMADRYAEMVEIVDRACSGGVPGRAIAQRYAVCRQALVQEVDRSALPGFVIQCISIDRFVEFITLFHHDVDARRQFIAEQLNRYHRVSSPHRSIDIFNAPL